MRTSIISDNSLEPEAKALVTTLTTTGLPEDCRIIYQARNTVVVTADGRYCIKAFKPTGLIKGGIYKFFRAPKAYRAYTYAQRLRAMGIDTPEPIAAIAFEDALHVSRAYFVSRFLDGRSMVRQAEKRPDFPQLARALAAFMLALHRNKVWMKDFTPGNILFRKNEDGTYEFSLVDINRMRFDVEDREKLLLNFRSPLDTPEGTRTLALEYGRQAGEADPEKFADAMMEIYHDFQEHLERKRAFKRKILNR